MRLLICLSMLTLLACSAEGCMFFPKTYDGSESFSAAHPEYGNSPEYMRADGDNADNR